MRHQHESAALIARNGELLAVVGIEDGRPPKHIEHDRRRFAFHSRTPRTEDRDEWDYEYREHKHAEAFALMGYRGGGRTLPVWNTRDGVTPFIIKPFGVEMTHVNWGSDTYDPERVPEVGEHVFIDLTYQLAQKLADDFMDANWDSMRQQPEHAEAGRDDVRRRQAARYIADARDGAPYYLRATVELQHAIENLNGLMNRETLARTNTEATRLGTARWWWNPGDPFYTCSYCGSVHPAAIPAILTTPGAHYSGSDWKYGYPHKFYVDVPEDALWTGSPKWHGKFYTRHLQDLTPAELDPIAFLIRGFFGVDFRNEDGKVIWRAPYGTQRFGTVP